MLLMHVHGSQNPIRHHAADVRLGTVSICHLSASVGRSGTLFAHSWLLQRDLSSSLVRSSTQAFYQEAPQLLPSRPLSLATLFSIFDAGGI